MSEPLDPRRRPDDRPLSYLEVLDDEYWVLSGETRSKGATTLRDAYVQALDQLDQDDQGAVALTKAESAFRQDVIKRLHHAKRAGLCFSGGGIRHAAR